MSDTVSSLNSVKRLLVLPLTQEQDVVDCRHRTRQIAQILGFDRQEQVKLATAVSELARNAFRYARGAIAEFGLQEPRRALHVVVRDKGPGISHLDSILDGTFRSETGLGMGIIGARRLSDSLDIQTAPQGTVVTLTKRIPARAKFEESEVGKLIAEAGPRSVPTALEQLSTHNRELILALETIRSQQDEMEKINVELSETNRGVVALYDELDTVYRVGRVVAAKLNLQSLLQAITDATLDVSGAELSAFLYRATESDLLSCQSLAGPQGFLSNGWRMPTLTELVDWVGEGAELRRFDDVSEPMPLGKVSPIRSLMVVLVRDPAGVNSGALVFGHRKSHAFSERTERILSSVAVQASIGLENARLYESVQAASAAKDQFLAILSHELRTPLTPVFAVLTALRDDPSLSEETQTDLEVMHRNLQLEARLIDDLLDLTKIVRGKIPLRLELVDAHALLDSVRHTCETVIAKRGVDVEMKLGAERHQLMVDAARLQQVFWNLLSNAVKFTPEGGTIEVETRAEGDSILVSVKDSGRGIEGDALERIFHPFEQGDSVVASQFGGLGLGLAISRTIVDAHGGEISAESRGAGQGATFIVKLPLAEIPEETGVGKQPAVESPRRVSRILLIDDHDDTRRVLFRLLQRSGYRVSMAASCAEALEAFSKNEFDMVISDLGLPDGSGHQLMETLQAIRPVKGIALSGFGMESDVERSRHAGFSAHMTKPIDYAQLDRTIGRLVDGQ